MTHGYNYIFKYLGFKIIPCGIMKTIEFMGDRVVILDQTLLPEKIEYIECREISCIAEAIKSLRIRGAPALGIAAAFALALTVSKNSARSRKGIIEALDETYKVIKATRPTAVNLVWALDRVMEKVRVSEDPSGTAISEALRIYEEDLEINGKLSRYGAELLESGDIVQTHCNAGGLATGGIGTALGVILEAWKQGKEIRVFADETRPLLQGARLTAFELSQAYVPVTVITDSMAGFVMRRHNVTKVIVGADRIAANGDTANKIGTYTLAVLAKEHKVPFYVAAPLSTIDLRAESGEDIPIEYRKKEELEFFSGKRIVPPEANILNPAFDVTPAEYITAIITEKGVLRPNFKESIRRAFE